MKYSTYDGLTAAIAANFHTLPREIDLIAGIPRSGLKYRKCFTGKVQSEIVIARQLYEACSLAEARLEYNSWIDADDLPNNYHAITPVAIWVAAPMLVSYVAWILKDAQERGITRLYFLSRDGQILLHIAQALVARSPGDTIELRYLYASRQAWNRTRTEAQLMQWVWDDLSADATPETLLKRLGLDAELCQWIAQRHLIPLQAPLNESDNLSQMRTLLECEAFQRDLDSVVRDKGQLLIEHYLKQEGLFENVPSAIVDIGWIGTLHETLAKFQTEKSALVSHGYLFGVKRFMTDNALLRHGFFFDRNRQKDADMILQPPDLFVLSEVFCAADHGTVVGFKRGAKQVEPIVAEGWHPRVEAWGQQLFRKAVITVAEQCDISTLTRTDLEKNRPLIESLLKTFWLNPTRDEAIKWASFPWDAGQGNEQEVIALAEPYGWQDIWRFFRRRSIRKRHIFWIYGGLAMSSLFINLMALCHFKVVKTTKNLRKRVASNWKAAAERSRLGWSCGADGKERF